MAYESIDVQRAKEALNICLNTLNTNNSENIITSLSGTNIWDAESKGIFTNALSTLINTRYTELRTYINNCLTKLDNIQKYKELQAENSSYEDELQSKRYQLYEAEKLNNQYKYRNKYYSDDAINNRKKIERLKTEIYGLENSINNNSDEMYDLGITID